MKKTRIFAAIVGVAALSLSMAACSSSSSGSSSSGSGGKQALTIEDYYTATYNPNYQKCAAKTNVSLTINHVAGAGLIAKVLQQVSSKTMPDVLMLDNPDVQQIAATGALTPLTNYGLSATGDASAVKAAGTYKGKLYALAPVINSIALYYNVDILKAAGVTPPTTWAELQADASKLTDPSKGQYGFAMSNINTYEGSWQFLPFLWTNGGDEKNIDTPQAEQALSFDLALQADGSMSKSSVSWAQADVNNQFVAGKAAMMINGPWQLPVLNATKGLNFASVPIPGRLASQHPVTPLGGETFTVPNTGNKDKMTAAGKFVGCLNAPSMQTTIAGNTGNIPSNLTQMAAWGKSHPQVASFVATLPDARARTGELGPKWPQAATNIYTAVQLALTGKATPAAALKQAQAGSN